MERLNENCRLQTVGKRLLREGKPTIAHKTNALLYRQTAGNNHPPQKQSNLKPKSNWDFLDESWNCCYRGHCSVEKTHEMCLSGILTRFSRQTRPSNNTLQDNQRIYTSAISGGTPARQLKHLTSTSSERLFPLNRRCCGFYFWDNQRMSSKAT